MAKGQFHIAYAGPMPCTSDRCPFEDHYDSLESAHDIHTHSAEVKRLRGLIKTARPFKSMSSSIFFYREDKLTARDFGRDVDMWFTSKGLTPRFFDAYSGIVLKDGIDPKAAVGIRRAGTVDEVAARIVGIWTISAEVKQEPADNTESLRWKEVFDYSTREAVGDSLLAVAGLFRAALLQNGASGEAVDIEAGRMLEHFEGMFNAVESEATGDYGLWGLRMGYFTASDGETIVANEPYRTSAFRAENFRRFLADNPWYRSRQPEAEIRVTDTREEAGAAWTLKREDGRWSIEKIYGDGRVVAVDVETAQDALDHVYHFNHAEIDPGDEPAALVKGRYAFDLVRGVELALEANAAAIARQQQEHSVHQDPDSVRVEAAHPPAGSPRASRLGSIFKIFG